MTSQLVGLKRDESKGFQASKHRLTQARLTQARHTTKSIIPPPYQSPYACVLVPVPPLDFSFCSLASLDDCESDLIMPRNEELQDCWQKKDSSTSEIAMRGKNSCQYTGGHLRLCHNSLKHLAGLARTVATVFLNPESLTWVDVSFNNLDKINTDLTELHNLKILYIHGNDIDNLKEVNKLASLQTLFKLTLNGNPLDQNKFYRPYVISHVPSLLNLDFSMVTRGDRATAQWFAGVSEGAGRRRPRRGSY